VAHNAPFDLRFLNYERRRTVGRYFTQPWLDTLVLARRLLRDRIERHNLRSLADWAGTDARPCHRALPDAEATAEVLTALVPLLQQRGTVTLQDAVLFATPRVNRYAHKLALAEDLPAGPGVYLMKDAAGKVLYVGKAGNLKRRVRSYFGPGGQHSRRIGRALSELERVEHEPTGSEFEALLREGELIRDLRPPCNHRGLRVRGHYLKLTVQEAYPRVIVVDTPTDDDAAYFGPLRSPRLVAEARRVLQAAYPVRACHPICRPGNALGGCAGGPCGVEDPERYAAATTALADLLSGDAGEMGRLPARLAQAFADGALSRGDQDTDAIAGLLRVLASLGRVRALGRLSGVVVEPAVEQRRTNLFFIGGGRLVHRAQVAGQAWRPTASDGLAAIAASERRRLEPLTLPDLDVAGLVEDRLREPHPDGGVRLDSGWEPADAMAALDRALTARRGGRSSRRAPRAA
jgi:DNA polymerase-3 subunit epsilon